MDSEISHIVRQRKYPIFEKFIKKAIRNISEGKSFSVYGLPGYGDNFLIQKLKLGIKKDLKGLETVSLNMIFPDNKIKALNIYLKELIRKSRVNEAYLTQYLRKKKITILIENADANENREFYTYLDALKSIGKEQLITVCFGSYKLFSNKSLFQSFAPNIFYPAIRADLLDEFDSELLIELYNREYNWNIAKNDYSQIFKLSGGNFTLIKNICLCIYEHGPEILKYPNNLIDIEPLKSYLINFSELLSVSSSEELQHLEFTRDGLIFSPLVKLYLKNQKDDIVDRMYPDLSVNEKNLMSLFLKNFGEIVTKEQITLVLNYELHAVSNWAIYKAIERLRKQIKSVYTISSVKQRGWILKKNERSKTTTKRRSR